jgi:hypothetical protein
MGDPYRSPKYVGAPTDSSRAEKLWLVCGVVGNIMLCDRERVKNFMLLSILKKIT